MVPNLRTSYCEISFVALSLLVLIIIYFWQFFKTLEKENN